MGRPVTLFTGQWADLSFDTVVQKAKSFGYDGLELGCWGDHFEVDKADQAYGDAKRMLEEHWDQVVAVAEALLVYETLSGDDVGKLMRGEKLTRPTVAEEIKAEARRRMSADVVAKLEGSDVSGDVPPGALPTPA
jgi:sugar phosphate isomerase/epimerase